MAKHKSHEQAGKDRVMEKLRQKEQEMKFNEPGRLQERRKIINLIVEIPRVEGGLAYQQKMIEKLQAEVDKGKIETLNREGKVMKIDDVKEVIKSQQSDLRLKVRDFNFMQEDLFYLTNGHAPEEIVEQLKTHYEFINDDVKKLREVFKYVI